MKLFLIYLCIVVFLAIIYYFVLKQTKENFENDVKNENENKNDETPIQKPFQFETKTINTNDYLFPTKDLQKICNDKGFAPSYGPKGCFKNGDYDPYANCECENKETGNCETCYSDINPDKKSASVIYNATKF